VVDQVAVAVQIRVTLAVQELLVRVTLVDNPRITVHLGVVVVVAQLK
jgi:hypothetical protein